MLEQAFDWLTKHHLHEVADIVIILSLLAYLLREFFGPWYRRVRLKRPVTPFFIITSPDRYTLYYAVQDTREHLTEVLVLPANTDDLLLHFIWKSKLNFTQYYLELSFEQNRFMRYLPRWWKVDRKRPQFHYWFHPFIRVGQSIRKPGEYPGHYIDYHDNYHIEEKRQRAKGQIVTYAFKISTHDPGKYALKIGITADAVEGTAWLDVHVKETPKRKMRCVEHRFCRIKPSRVIRMDQKQSEKSDEKTAVIVLGAAAVLILATFFR
jgi:hypothetical protein